jgi:hypothetical protein
MFVGKNRMPVNLSQPKNMNRIILLLLLLTISKLYSQKIEKEIGAIKITKEGFFIGENGKIKKRKISKAEFYFDNYGKILEKISYGKYHYNKLNVIGEIEQFFYTENKLETSKKYVSSCFSSGYYLYYSKFKYDEKDRLINEERFHGENDSLFMTSTHLYNSNVKEIHFNSSTFYQKIYDDANKIIELNQINEVSKKIRWQYLYEYSDNCKIGNFQTYYGDGKENSKREIECFDSEKRLISKEIVSGYKTKILYSYSKEGFLTEIKEYESFSDEEFKLKSIIRFEINRKGENLSKEVITKINSEFIEY